MADKCEDDGNAEPDCWTDNLAMAWVLIGAALEADDWERDAIHDLRICP